MATNEITFVLTAARAVLADKVTAGHTFKGVRPLAALEFIAAETDDARQEVVDNHGAGTVRRGLRQFARKVSADAEVQDLFWFLRDLIDPTTGDVDSDESADIAVAA